MAKQQNPSGDERSDVEFLYFKGKLRSQDIQALVSGFASTRSSAFPARAPQKRIAAPVAEDGVVPSDQEVDLDTVEEAETEENGASTSRSPKTSRAKRTYPTPDPVNIDLEFGDKPFVTFATEKAPGSHRDRYLVVAEWLRAYRETTTVTAGHVRTCYIRADWDFDLQDPTQPFRKLKKEGLGAVSDGQFTINHLGTAEVKKMNAGAKPLG